MKTHLPALLLSTGLFVLGLACSATGGANPTPALTQAITPEPTIANEPTPGQTPEVPTPTPKPPAFFAEEFDTNYPAHYWQSFTLGKGSSSKLVIQQEEDHLVFDMGNEGVYAYYMYTPYTYKDVSLSLNAENRGRNNNNVSLICRMNREGTHWYEFSVSNSGLWTLFAMDKVYNTLGSGGTNLVRPGKEVNRYQMICDGNEITLIINGGEVGIIQDNKYGFQEGFAGFNVASIAGFSVLPITVEIDSFEIAPP